MEVVVISMLEQTDRWGYIKVINLVLRNRKAIMWFTSATKWRSWLSFFLFDIEASLVEVDLESFKKVKKEAKWFYFVK